MKVSLMIVILFCSWNAYATKDLPELSIEQVDMGVFLHKSFSHTTEFGLVSSNGLVVVNDGNAFIVDTPWSDTDTAELVNWINERRLKLLGSISTHSHEDRTAGIKWLNDHSIPTYASELTNRFLKREGKALAKYSFKENDFKLRKGLIEVFYPGGGHTKDNLVVWLPKSKILFGGCFVRSLSSKGLGYTDEAYVDEWSSSVDKVIAKFADIEVVIPGHGGVGNKELLKHTKKLVAFAAKKSMDSSGKKTD